MESTNEGSLHPSEGEDADGTSRELLADAEELERARAVVSGREVKLKTEEYSDDYWGGHGCDGGDNDRSLQDLTDESSLEGGGAHMGAHMGGLQVLTGCRALWAEEFHRG